MTDTRLTRAEKLVNAAVPAGMRPDAPRIPEPGAVCLVAFDAFAAAIGPIGDFVDAEFNRGLAALEAKET